ncbi:hypothetical protein C8Q78DRAFT_1074638 [Trametes maxima]|nr:hypothetical protein C8Q78DRAFT_1074638 [Trametes maxima]
MNSPRSTSRRRSDPPRPLASYPSISKLPLHFRVSAPGSRSPAEPLPESQPQVQELDELRRSLRTSDKERDMYRTRALQLALRLDGSCRAHAQTEDELECVQRDLARANRVTGELEAERRDLSVALAVVLTSNGTSVKELQPVAALIDQSECASTQSPRPAHEEAVSYPRTPTKSTSDEEKRPLLLPPTVSTILDTPTRSRITAWSSSCSKPALGDVAPDKRRRGSRARAQSQNAGVASVPPPVFTVQQVGNEGNRRDADVGSPPFAVHPVDDRITKGLRASRRCTTPDDSPKLTQDSRGETHTVPNDKPVQRETLTVPVEIIRQPFGPPPSPKAAEKGHTSATNRGEHTWRGRVRPLDPTAGPTATDAETSQPYPGSRMPNRMRQRQTTAPPPDTACPSAGPSRQPRMTRAASIDAIGAERKRHATFNGRDGPATTSGKAGGSRWPKR